MKNQCRKMPDVVLKVDLQHCHPLDKSKHLSCHNILPIITTRCKIQNLQKIDDVQNQTHFQDLSYLGRLF